MKLIFRLLFLFITIVTILSSCQKKLENQNTDTIIIAISTEPKRLNPLFLSDFISYSVSGLVFNGLTKFDKDMNITGDLAESWDISKDGLEIKFYLKRNVLWHDGVEFTAEDVVFTYKSIISPLTGSYLSSQFGPIKEVKAIDKYTLLAIYSKPYGSALESWAIGIIPKHVFHNKDVNSSFFDESPIGTGPYKLKEWVHGQKILLEAFNYYHNGKPKIKNIILRVIPDTATQLLELRTGSIDMMEITPNQFNTLKDRNFIKYRANSFRYGFLGLNLKDRKFQDKTIRQAISYAINKKFIIKSVLYGLGNISTGPYPPEAWYYNQNVRNYDYNPEKALDMLEKAGWKKNKKGILQKEDMYLSFTIYTNYESNENIKTAQIIQNNLKSIGIETKILTFDWQTFRHNIINKHKFEAVILSRTYLWDPDIYELWHSSKTNEGEWNFLSYKNKAVDELLEKGRSTVNISERKIIYKKIHELLAEEQPCIFLYNADLLFVANKKIKGITPSPMGMLYGIEKCWIESHGVRSSFFT